MKTSFFRSLRWLPYRVVRRLAVANVCHVYQSPIDKIPRTRPPDGYTIESCPFDRLREHAHEVGYQIPESDLEKLDTGESKCFAAFQADSLAGFAWVTFGDIPGDMNHDGKPETGLPVQLSDDAAFVFQVLVLPAYRGRHLYAAIVSQMADDLQTEGIRSLVLTTEGCNHHALRAVERMDFRKLGQASFFKIGPLSRATYPKLTQDCCFKLGHYTGDEPTSNTTSPLP